MPGYYGDPTVMPVQTVRCENFTAEIYRDRDSYEPFDPEHVWIDLKSDCEMMFPFDFMELPEVENLIRVLLRARRAMKPLCADAAEVMRQKVEAHCAERQRNEEEWAAEKRAAESGSPSADEAPSNGDDIPL